MDADTAITVGVRQSNHAGLTAAAAACTGLACELVLSRLALGAGSPSVVIYSVLTEAEQTPIAIVSIAKQTAKLLDPALDIDSSAITIEAGELGEGNGIPTEGMIRAVSIESGRYKAGQAVLFNMTCGMP